MRSKSNVLVLSVGTRNKVIEYFKKEAKKRGAIVVAADSSKYAPALYSADSFKVIPRISDSKYLEEVLKICEEYEIGGVLSLIDPELSIISKHENLFIEKGIMPIISKEETIETCFDKYKMYKSLDDFGINSVMTFVDVESFNKALQNKEIKFPVFVKPRKGSASVGIQVINNIAELKSVVNTDEELIIQEFMTGKEFGADVYVDMISGEVISIFVKEKILMRAGETDKAISIVNKQISEKIVTVVEKLNLRGIIDIDLFEKNGEIYISEVNPRFGGGFPHAYECGINVPAMILNNVDGKVNEMEDEVYEEGVVMMKYNEVLVKKMDEN